MRNPKYYIAIDEYKRRMIINSLNNLRNKLIAEWRYIDAVDDVLVGSYNQKIFGQYERYTRFHHLPDWTTYVHKRKQAE